MADAPVTFSDAIKRELQEAARGGIWKLKEHIKSKNSEWKKIPLNIGITGGCGVGKSSFINAIRGITADDEGAAHVDSIEASKEVKPYVHPKNENMILWRLPGVGTPNFPRSTYLKQVELDRFDFFLILSAGRFREDDLWLAEELYKLKKKCHFVRTQMDIEVETDKRHHPQTHNKDKVIEKVRNNCVRNFGKHGLTKASVFLIDNYSVLDFDFDSLITTLIDEAPEHKKEAMTLSMSILSKRVFERKVEALRGRIYKISILSAFGAAIPVPGLGMAVDVAILLEEVIFYKKQLGLDASTMKENAQLLNTETRALQKELGLQSVELAETAHGFTKEISKLTLHKALQSMLPIVIPFTGSLIAAGLSYGMSVSSLNYYLDICAIDARKIKEELMKHALQ